MLNKLVKICDKRYHSHTCKSCSYENFCPNSCEKCLEYIHFPDRSPAKREYDCKRMTDFYVCKYAYKYTSELIYALKNLQHLQKKKKLHVLSIGCGPCTDLLALNYLENNGIYSFETIEYRGVEINTEIWSNIIKNISDMIPDNWSFEIIYKDFCDYIDILLQQTWKPNLIVIQYVFSDMRKNIRPDIIDTMIKSLAQYIDSCEKNTYVVCNDINLTINRNGGREYFDQLYDNMHIQATQQKLHFKNSIRSNHFEYGEEYETNDLIISPSKELDFYHPYTSCASAQMLIKKEE